MRANWVHTIMLTVGVLLCGTRLAFARAAYALLPIGGPEVAANARSNFLHLLEMALAQEGYTVEVLADTSCTNVACAVELAKAKSNYVVLGEFLPVGAVYKIRCRLIEVASGEILLDDASPKARMEELDTVADRWGQALIQRRSFAETIERGTAVAQEAMPVPIRSVRIMYGGELGAGYIMTGNGARQTQVVLDGAVLFPVDPVTIETRLGLRFDQSGSTQANEVALDVGARYYFGQRNTAPFLIGSAGAHFQTVTATKGEWGLGLNAGGGIAFLRTTRIEVPITVKYQYVLLPSTRDAHAILTTLGVYF